MSGGRLNYFYNDLESHIGDFKDKELDDLVADLAELFHEREWYLSGDTGEGNWVEARDSFKSKWFTKSGRKQRIEKYLEEIKKEILESFSMSEMYCENCMHWKKYDKPGYEKYGTCDLVTTCLMHRKESCDKFRFPIRSVENERQRNSD